MTPTASAESDTRNAVQQGAYRTVIVDGHCIFRQALRVLLAADAKFTVVGDAGQASEALELIDTLHPDVVIADLNLSDGGGVKIIEQIHARFPKIAILVLTAARARDVALAAKKAGALGYLLKDQGRDELFIALHEVAAGRPYRSVVPAVLAARALVDEEGQLSTRAAYLTERQRQVLRSVALGYRTREIAVMLGVSVKAVHRQRERLRSILRLNSTAALTRFAVREGLAHEVPPNG